MSSLIPELTAQCCALPLSPPDVKDDSCSTCAGFTDDQIYARMWSAIQASGRPMVLTVEGQPTDSIITHGGYGNAKRVGHDISPVWDSMTSLIDAGSGLYMFAHNSTNPLYGGWWNGECAGGLRWAAGLCTRSRGR